MEQVLAPYARHDLARQDAAALMDRVDTKFVLPEAQLMACLAGLSGDYSLLEIDGHCSFGYENFYFDNAGLDFYRAHHNTRLNRYKVRERRYAETDNAFLEVKFKNNKKRTIKRRIAIDPRNRQHEEYAAFLRACLPFDPAELEPVMFVGYRRRTLLNTECTERVTLDTGLHFHSLRSGKRLDLPGLAVIEAKTARKAGGSAIMAALKAAGVKPMRLSKYCTGMALTDTVKRNQFKPKLMHIERLLGRPLDTIAHAVN